MAGLLSVFPTADELLATSPEDLAPILLRLAQQAGGPSFWPPSVAEITRGTGIETTVEFAYPYYKKSQVESLINEAWESLRRDGLIMPAPGINGQNGRMVLTSAGAGIASREDFGRVRAALAFPKSLLHPSIADKVFAALMRNELDEAVFAAFKAVEVAVRAAGNYKATDISVPLMRKAFDAKAGPLSDQNQPEAEREALCHLFAGAIGSYKNPHSHGTVALTDLREAQQQVMLATHLLSIVDARRS
jgi:uncharacterized protein (TIGR02391 family)